MRTFIYHHFKIPAGMRNDEHNHVLLNNREKTVLRNTSNIEGTDTCTHFIGRDVETVVLPDFEALGIEVMRVDIMHDFAVTHIDQTKAKTGYYQRGQAKASVARTFVPATDGRQHFKYQVTVTSTRNFRSARHFLRQILAGEVEPKQAY